MHLCLKISILASVISVGLSIPLFVGIIGVSKESKLKYTWVYVPFFAIMMTASAMYLIVTYGYLVWKYHHPDSVPLLPDPIEDEVENEMVVVTE